MADPGIIKFFIWGVQSCTFLDEVWKEPRKLQSPVV